jgi:hypothetical protein
LVFKKGGELRALSLPAAASIDSGAFEETAALTCLVFGANPPELAAGVFKNAGFPQTGIVYVLPDAVEAYQNTGLDNWSGLKERVRPLPGGPAAP